MVPALPQGRRIGTDGSGPAGMGYRTRPRPRCCLADTPLMIGSGFPDRRHIWLATEPAAIRMTHDGLSALVRNRLGSLVCLPQSAADHAQGHRLRPGRHLDLVQAPGVRSFQGACLRQSGRASTCIGVGRITVSPVVRWSGDP